MLLSGVVITALRQRHSIQLCAANFVATVWGWTTCVWRSGVCILCAISCIFTEHSVAFALLGLQSLIVKYIWIAIILWCLFIRAETTYTKLTSYCIANVGIGVHVAELMDCFSCLSGCWPPIRKSLVLPVCNEKKCCKSLSTNQESDRHNVYTLMVWLFIR